MKARGFTLIELLVTLAILSILALISLPLAQTEVQRVREHDLQRSLREIRSAIDAYKIAYDQGRILRTENATGYPPSLRILVDGVEDAGDPQHHRIHFLRRVPRDPMSHDNTLPDEDTWGKRCYDSSADDPREGADVYDIYSLSTRKGLDGVPYRRW